MRLKSRGLGRKELVMDFREYTVVRDGDEVLVVGTIREPVNWDFSIRLCEDDLPGIARIALEKPMWRYLLRALFRRRRRHHWTQEWGAHLAEARRRREEARQRFRQAPAAPGGRPASAFAASTPGR